MWLSGFSRSSRSEMIRNSGSVKREDGGEPGHRTKSRPGSFPVTVPRVRIQASCVATKPLRYLVSGPSIFLGASFLTGHHKHDHFHRDLIT